MKPKAPETAGRAFIEPSDPRGIFVAYCDGFRVIGDTIEIVDVPEDSLRQIAHGDSEVLARYVYPDPSVKGTFHLGDCKGILSSEISGPFNLHGRSFQEFTPHSDRVE